MSEMVERVRRAVEGVPIVCGTYGLSGDDAVAVARAAIAAMREPTVEMRYAIPPRFTTLTFRDVGDIYRSMIDAALSEEKQPA